MTCEGVLFTAQPIGHYVDGAQAVKRGNFPDAVDLETECDFCGHEIHDCQTPCQLFRDAQELCAVPKPSSAHHLERLGIDEHRAQTPQGGVRFSTRT